MTHIVALVPMRHTSQRVPGKNYRPLAGRPLFHYILDILQRVPAIESIAVDTDSDIIMEGLRRQYPNVAIIVRPDHLRANDVPMNDILEYDTSQIRADLFLQTHTTNPLLRPETISRAIEDFVQGGDRYDSLFSVTRWQTRLYDQDGRAINHDPHELIQTQDLQPVFEENSCLYLFTTENLLRDHHRIGKQPLLFEIDAAEAWDIDDELDFSVCEFLMSRSRGKGELPE